MNSIFVIIIIVLIKAIFAAAETSFTYLNKAKIHQLSKKNKKAQKINEMIEKNHKLFGLTEIGITICELFASAVAAETFVKDLEKVLISISISGDIAMILSIVIVTLILSYFSLVIGLLLPKRIARNHPELTAFRLIGILNVLSIINYPFEKLVEFSTKIICKTFGIKENAKDKLTEREIKMIILEGKEQGVIDKVEKEILIKALRYNDILVKEVMMPKEKVNFINSKDDTKKILANIKEHEYTRMPVFEENKDNVIGIINIKDIILGCEENEIFEINTKRLLRPATFISKDERISNAFNIMQSNNQAMLVVIDDNKKVVGIITLEDILEKLVGNILDEYGK